MDNSSRRDGYSPSQPSKANKFFDDDNDTWSGDWALSLTLSTRLI